MKIEIAQFQDGYYYVVDGVKQHKVNETDIVQDKQIPKMVVNPVPHVGRDGKANNLSGEELLQRCRKLFLDN